MTSARALVGHRQQYLTFLKTTALVYKYTMWYSRETLLTAMFYPERYLDRTRPSHDPGEWHLNLDLMQVSTVFDTSRCPITMPTRKHPH